MKKLATTADSLEKLKTQIKIKLVENHVLENAFNQQINRNCIEIGRDLSQAKKLLPHGQWQIWLADNFNMTLRTAQNYMKVFRYFGVNSTLKNENVFAFAPAALIELTKLPAAEVNKFLEEETAAGVEVQNLSVRNLRAAIKKYQPNKGKKIVTVSKMPPTFFLPASLIEKARRAGFSIELEFNRSVKIKAEIMVTKIATGANWFSLLKEKASAVIFCPAMTFQRSDGGISKIKTALWFFGTENQKFFQHFGELGSAFVPMNFSF